MEKEEDDVDRPDHAVAEGKKGYKRFAYNIETLQKAIEDVKSGRSSANKASKVFGIPKGTLIKKLHSNEPLNLKMGPSSVLTPKEESKLEEWILGKAKLGFPMHPEEVKDAVEKIIRDLGRETPFINYRPGRKWMDLFLKRHPNIVKKNAEIVSKARSQVTESKIRDWFRELLEYLKEENAEDILDCPERIFNLDETGVCTCPKSGKLLGPKGYRNFYEIAPGPEKQCITVLCNFNAAGEALEPMIVFPYKRIPRDITDSVPPGFAIGRSDSGWMVSETFFEYIANIFYPSLVESNVQFPVILLLDGHKSHINEQLYIFCKDKKILLFCLLPNATHILQPCDVSIFKPLKSAWKKSVHKFKQETKKSVSRLNFAPLFQEAFRAITQESIKNGFKACGIYPFNPDEVDYTKCIPDRPRLECRPTDDPEIQCSTNEYKTACKVLEREMSEETRVSFVTAVDKNEVEREIEPELRILFQIWRRIKEKAGDLQSADCAVTVENDEEPATTERPTEESINLSDVLISFEDAQEQTGLNESSLTRILCEEPAVEIIVRDSAEVDIQPRPSTSIEKSHKAVENEDSRPIIEISNEEPALQVVSTIKSKFNEDLKRHDEVGLADMNPWSKHLHWPVTEVTAKKRRRSQERVPFAITSTKWKEFHEKKALAKEIKETEAKIKKEKREEAKAAKQSEKQNKGNRPRRKLDEPQKRKAKKLKTQGAQPDLTFQHHLTSQPSTSTLNINPPSIPPSTSSNPTRRILPKPTSTVTREDDNEFNVNDYVIFRYEDENRIPGQIIEKKNDPNRYRIKEFVRLGRTSRWYSPHDKDQLWYDESKIVKKIHPPEDKNDGLFVFYEFLEF